MCQPDHGGVPDRGNPAQTHPQPPSGPTQIATAYGFRGKVGADIDVETAYRAAGVTILSCLSTLRAEMGDLDRVEQVVKLFGILNSAAGFNKQPQVINGASDRLVEIFGDRGRHARSAVGMAELPGDIAVEIELIVKVAD